jgi:hypothetical protein
MTEAPVDLGARKTFAGWPMIIGWAAMLIFVFYSYTHMRQQVPRLFGTASAPYVCGQEVLTSGANHGDSR